MPTNKNFKKPEAEGSQREARSFMWADSSISLFSFSLEVVIELPCVSGKFGVVEAETIGPKSSSPSASPATLGSLFCQSSFEQVKRSSGWKIW